MATKICWKCKRQKPVQPHYGNEISYWLCMRCSGPHLINKDKPIPIVLLRVMSVTEFLRAA